MLTTSAINLFVPPDLDLFTACTMHAVPCACVRECSTGYKKYAQGQGASVLQIAQNCDVTISEA